MQALFLKVLNTSMIAAYLVLVVILLRLLLRKAPRWTFVLLWAIVALRLICPFSIETSISLIPNANPIGESVLSDTGLHMQPEFPSVDNLPDDPFFVPDFGETIRPDTEKNEPASVMSAVWVTGAGAMAIYSLCSYLHLRRRVFAAVRLRDNIYLSENVVSPFILGVFMPRIYLPYGLNDVELTHILSHEQAHIDRKDHWWKPLGFLLLSVHWFNPLMWVALFLLNRDIEQACDEKVIRAMETQQRADYSETLLRCSVSRRTIAACPLAFGEVGVKERVKNVLSYKKPGFWIIMIAVVACCVVAACFLTDPVQAEEESGPNKMSVLQNDSGTQVQWCDILNMYQAESGDFQLDAFPKTTFRWNGGKVEAVTNHGTETLIDAAKLYYIAATDLNKDGYPEISCTASDGENSEYVIVHDYKAGKTYTFSDGTSEYAYYLYIRAGYLMCGKDSIKSGRTVESGRLLLTEGNGNVSLAICAPWEPEHFEGGAVIWYDKNDPDSPDRGQQQLNAFPGVMFRWDHKPNVIDAGDRLVAVKNGEETVLFPNGATMSVYVADVTGDGKPDICANVYHFFSGMPSYNEVCVYDYANDAYYRLSDAETANHDTKVSYYLQLSDGNLVCHQVHEATGQVLASGVLKLEYAENGQYLYMQMQIQYDSPVRYEFHGENYFVDVVYLTVCADGSCNILFNSRMNDDHTSNWAQGMCHTENDRLILTTEEGITYTFRFEGDDLVFLARKSDPLPDDCPLYNGAVLQAHPFFD